METTKFEIEVTGEGSKQPVIIEVKSDDKPTLPAVTYCNFDYDFVKGEIVGSITYTDPDAFKTAIASTQYTVPTFTGKTPFPCAYCNPKMKFNYLEKYADNENCYYISIV